MEFMSFIMDNCLIVVPALYIIGAIIKGIPNIPNWIIPFALLVAGIALCIAMSLLTWSDITIIEAIIQGVLVTGAAVLVNQGIKQATERE